MKKLRVAVLISGRGSNLKALIDAAAQDDYPAHVVLVISNVPEAGGLEIAERAGVPAQVIDHKLYGPGRAGKKKFEAVLSAKLKEAGAELVCLAGFMRLFSPGFVDEWSGRIVNIHPSLLPAFKGLDVHAAMLKAGVKIAGCTVHFVSSEMDAGPIIGQAAVPVATHDTPQSLAARILQQEHRLYPECVRMIATGAVTLGADGRATFASRDRSDALLNPAPA